jgi:hypothetical protein
MREIAFAEHISAEEQLTVSLRKQTVISEYFYNWVPIPHWHEALRCP